MSKHTEKINNLGKQNVADYPLVNSWVNADNANFYNNVPIDFFVKVAAQGGLDNGCDILAINQYIKKAESILEVGAGYGRVIDAVLKQGFCGRLTAIERNPVLYEHLQEKFGNKVKIIFDDIACATLPNKYDLILWMWTGICEFSKIEQCSVVNNLSKSLNTNGFIVIDVIPSECATQNAMDCDKHNRIITTPYGNNYCYLPDSFEIKEYANYSQLKQCKKIIYTTKTNKMNHLHIFQKNN